MMKGQAFDTFKLMIAAVIAVAILGILLSMLGGLTGGIGQRPVDIIKQKIPTARCAAQGSGSEIQFTAGDAFTTGTFYEATGYTLTSLDVKCEDYITTGNLATCATGQFVSNANFKAQLSLVCNSDGSTCHVIIGKPAYVSTTVSASLGTLKCLGG